MLGLHKSIRGAGRWPAMERILREAIARTSRLAWTQQRTTSTWHCLRFKAQPARLPHTQGIAGSWSWPGSVGSCGWTGHSGGDVAVCMATGADGIARRTYTEAPAEAQGRNSGPRRRQQEQPSRNPGRVMMAAQPDEPGRGSKPQSGTDCRPQSRQENHALRAKKRTSTLTSFKSALAARDVSRAEWLLQAYIAQLGGIPREWMYNSLITAHARRSDLQSALAVGENMKAAGLRWDRYTYAAVLNACSKADMPPYLLDREYAAMAQRFFREMRLAGIEPNHIIYHSLMDSQAKAGLVDEVFLLLEEMKTDRLEPTLFTYNIVINACGKAKQPMRAKEVVEEIIPAARLQADIVSWNGLLGAYTVVGQIDNAYHTWMEMKQLGLLPTRVTVRLLSEAMAGSPGFLDELLSEAKERLDASGSPKKATERDGGLFQAPEKLTELDLHRLSQASAQSELLRRLTLLTTLSSEEWEATGQANLKIVTGYGRHSRTKGVLREVVTDLLHKNDIDFTADKRNPGRIWVPREEVEALKARWQEVDAHARLLRYWSVRYMFVGCALFGLLSGTYMIRHVTQYL